MFQRCVIRAFVLYAFLFPCHTHGQSTWEVFYPSGSGASQLVRDSDSLFAVIDDNLFISGDCGENWRRVEGFHPQIYAMATDDEGLYIAAGKAGLFIRKHGDEKLRRSGIDTLAFYGILNHADTLFLNSRDALYTTIDRGIHFTRVSVIEKFRRFLFSDGIALYADIGTNYLARSEDGGVTWLQCSVTLDYGQQFLAHRGNLYCGISDVRALQRSTDRGATWKKVPSVPVDPRTDRFFMNLKGISTLTADEEALYINTGRGIFRSTDEGGSWQAISDADTRFKSMLKTPHCLLAGSAAGSFRYIEQARHWRQLPLYWFDAIPTLQAGGRFICDGGGRFSPDEGSSWWADSHSFQPVASRPDGTLYRSQEAGSDSAWLMMSIDNGMHWEIIDSLPRGRSRLAANDRYLIAAHFTSYQTTLRLSDDGGGIWVSILDHPVSLPNVTMNASNHILLNSGNTWLFSPDLGVSWDSVHSYSVDTIRRATLTSHSFFIETDKGIFRWIRPGEWEHVLVDQSISDARIAGGWRQYLCVLGRDSLHLLNEESRVWAAVPLPDPFRASGERPAFATSNSYVFVAQKFGMAYRLKPEGITSLHVRSLAGLDKLPIVVHMSPHPACGQVTIALDGQHDASVEVSVYDMQSRKVMDLYQGELGSGSQTIHGDVSMLPVGAYVLHIANESRRVFHPFIVAR
ncbi:MAG: hypothetical protein M5R41_04435 [Bacteroidia bacterium]|nr:hypothetical protein [Bacteroidia bacterium]